MFGVHAMFVFSRIYINIFGLYKLLVLLYINFLYDRLHVGSVDLDQKIIFLYIFFNFFNFTTLSE